MTLKQKIAAAITSVAAALGAAGYYGYQYFTEHYVLLNEQEAMQIMMMLMSCSGQRI